MTITSVNLLTLITAVILSLFEPQNKVSVKEITDSYIKLKNGLVKDNSVEAAEAGKILASAIKNFDRDRLSPEQKKVFDEIEDDARENAEHIAKNKGNISHQREHFEILSNDIYDFVKSTGAGQTLYRDFCPMYNKGKGAYWLSETKDIRNPYLGKSMPTCGVVKEEIK